MRIVIIGAGPSGCRAALRLALRGHQVRLLDSHAPWEKPCGGGLTSRALAEEFPAELEREPIAGLRVSYLPGLSFELALPEALAVVSRAKLGAAMLERATSAGVRFDRARVGSLRREGKLWRIRTREGADLAADLVVGADGATSVVRRQLGHPLRAADLGVTAGYFIPRRGRGESRMQIFFLPGLEGYAWSFPRPDHISFGLITRPRPGWATGGRQLLGRLIETEFGSDQVRSGRRYSAPVPCLRESAWPDNAVRGEDWALLGDAAGLVDPITGEGIYYAVRSADLLADTFPDLGAYEDAIRAECVPELRRASALYDLFYRGSFLGGAFTKRMVQLGRHSRIVRDLMGRLVTGSQPYTGLRAKLVAASPGVALEMLTSPFRSSQPVARGRLGG
jgi:geranylgeranyl reductase family protein